MLSDKVLKEYGFLKFSKLFLEKQEEAGYNPGYTHYARISDNIYLYYDIHGFMTLVQPSNKKGAAGTNNDAMITIPQPVRSIPRLKTLLRTLVFEKP